MSIFKKKKKEPKAIVKKEPYHFNLLGEDIEIYLTNYEWNNGIFVMILINISLHGKPYWDEFKKQEAITLDDETVDKIEKALCKKQDK